MNEVSAENNLSADEFYTRYMRPNKPVILSAELTEHWRARREWVDQHSGQPKWETLRKEFGTAIVTVAECSSRQYSDQKRSTMTFASFIDQWRMRDHHDQPTLYMKDWHICMDFPNYQAYETPPHFADDWINSYWDSLGVDDYRFCYMGPDGSWTPCHVDVFRSYSWSTNICGRKRWTFFPPEQRHLLRHRSSPDIYVYDIRNVNVQDFPGFSNTAPIVVVQEPGQTIFVPSGWFHQVHNIGDTISINHNWGNACNVRQMWQQLFDDFVLVQQAINDLKYMDGFAEHCQLMLRAHTGMNFSDFIAYLQHSFNHCAIIPDKPFRSIHSLQELKNVLEELTEQPVIQIIAQELLSQVQRKLDEF